MKLEVAAIRLSQLEGGNLAQKRSELAESGFPDAAC